MTAMVYSTLITTAATAKPKPFIWKVRVRHIATAPISAESTGTGEEQGEDKGDDRIRSQCP